MTVSYGADALFDLAHAIEQRGCSRVLLVTGRRSFETSGASAVVEPLRRFAHVERWSDFAPNTDAADLERGLAIARDVSADAIVGLGGGSVMDMAKLLCAFPTARDATELHDAIRSGGAITDRSVLLGLVPTTSGSGSEATHFAVVYIGAEKFSIGGPALRADLVALDPNLSSSGSAHQRATSGVDAICQSIESLWATGATDASRRYARRALGLLVGSIVAFVDAPTDRTARAMTIGSHLAGRAIDISKTTAAHALSYGITKTYGVDHGNAVALTLPQFIEAHAEPGPGRLRNTVDPAEHARAMTVIKGALAASTGAEARHHFRALIARLGLPATLHEVGASGGADLEALAGSVNVARLENNPVTYSPDQLADVLARSME